MPAVLFVEFGEPFNWVAIDPNSSGLPVQTEAWDFGRLQVVGHSDNIDSESLEFLGPLTLEVGHGGSNNVSKLITSVNPGQSEGSQEMGARITMPGRSVESHVSRVTPRGSSTLEEPCHTANLPSGSARKTLVR